MQSHFHILNTSQIQGLRDDKDSEGTNLPLEAADSLSAVSTIKNNSYCVSEVKEKPKQHRPSKCRNRCGPWGAPKGDGCMYLQRKGQVEEPVGRTMCSVGQAME